MPQANGAASEFAIETRSLTRLFGSTRAVDDLSLRVRTGLVFALLGPNGAGKSTTIQILTTLLAPTSGSAFVGSIDVTKEPRRVREVLGVVFQDVSLDDRLTADENLLLFGAIMGIASHERANRVRDALAWVGLQDTKKQLVRTFSGGMRRRLEIARALLHKPRVLVLDEPTVGLDPQTRRLVWKQLFALAREQKTTVFVTTHYMDEAEQADEIAIVDHGRLIAQGTPSELACHAGAERIIIATNDDEKAAAYLRDLHLEVEPSAEGIVLRGRSAEQMLAEVAAANVGLKRVRIARPSLEDAFVTLTGKRIRDEHDEAAGGLEAMRTQLRARGRR